MIPFDPKASLENDFNILVPEHAFNALVNQVNEQQKAIEQQAEVLNERIDSIFQEFQATSQQILIKNQQLEELVRERKELREENRLHAGRIINLTFEKRALQKDKDELRGQLDLTENERDQAIDKGKEIEKENKILKIQKEELIQKNSKLEDINSVHEGAAQASSVIIQMLKDHGAQLLFKNQELEVRNRKGEAERLALKDENDSLHSLLTQEKDLKERINLLSLQLQQKTNEEEEILKLMRERGIKLHAHTSLSEAVAQLFDIHRGLIEKNKELQTTVIRIEKMLGIEKGKGCDGILTAIKATTFTSNKLKELGDKLVANKLLQAHYTPNEVLEKLNSLLNDYLEFKKNQPIFCKELGIKSDSNLETIIKKMQEKVSHKKSGISAHFSRLGRSTLCLLSLGFANIV